MEKRRARIFLIFLGTALLITVIDLATKEWAERDLSRRPKPIPIVAGYLDFQYGENTGAAFGLLKDVPWGPDFLTVVSFAALLFLSWLALTIKDRPILAPISLGLVLGGVLGNLHDRLFNEGSRVRDFIDAQWGERHWPLFNVADACITVGVILLIYVSFFPGRKPPGKKGEARPAKA